MSRSRRLLDLRIDQRTLSNNLMPIELLSRVLAKLPADAILCLIAAAFDTNSDPLGYGSPTPDGGIIRASSYSFDEVPFGTEVPEMVIWCRKQGDRTEIWKIEVQNKIPSWFSDVVPTPAPPEPKLPDDWRKHLGVDLSGAGAGCQCDVAYNGGHFAHCSERNVRARR